MSIELIAALLFFLILSILAFVNRKKLTIQKIAFPVLYFIMYRMKFGLKVMDRFSKHLLMIVRICCVLLLAILIVFGYNAVINFSNNSFTANLLLFGEFVVALGLIILIFVKPIEGTVTTGFIGMAFIAYSLIDNVIKIITVPKAVAGVGLVLPFQVRGAFYVPFFYWLISIFILAIIHEGFHGIYARFWRLKVQSSGLAALAIFIPVLPVAFVEPDEKQMKKKGMKEQLSIFAAGPFSNIAVAFIILGLFALIVPPVVNSFIEVTGVEVTGLVEHTKDMPAYPAELAGISDGEIITRVNNIPIITVENFTNSLINRTPGEQIILKTNKKTYNITLGTNPDDKTKGYVGVKITQSQKVKDSVRRSLWIFPNVILWIFGLLYWLYVLNLGIGLFNLLPLGPVDGGRMILLVLQKYFSKETAKKLFNGVSLFFLFLIFVNIAFSFIKPAF
jgi:membrane-associated protease RseP (regulator of RpoE activity)